MVLQPLLNEVKTCGIDVGNGGHLATRDLRNSVRRRSSATTNANHANAHLLHRSYTETMHGGSCATTKPTHCGLLAHAARRHRRRAHPCGAGQKFTSILIHILLHFAFALYIKEKVFSLYHVLALIALAKHPIPQSIRQIENFSSTGQLGTGTDFKIGKCNQ
jgi:hypothetical protein